MATSTRGLTMNNPNVYFQREDWGDVAIQHNGQVHHFCNLVSLIGFLQTVHGHEFNLIEVDETNYHELQRQGAFDED